MIKKSKPGKLIENTRSMQDSGLKYKTIYENTNEAILIAQNDYFGFPNQAALSLFECTAEELTDRPLAQLIHPDHRAMVTKRHELRQKGEAFSNIYSFKILPKNTPFKWVELKVVLIEWDDAPATLCFMTDITSKMISSEELKLKTTELYNKTLQLDMLHETAVKITSTLDLKNSIQTILSQAAQMVGTQHGSVVLIEKTNGDKALKVDYATGLYKKYIGYTVGYGEGFVGEIWKAKKIMKIDDYQNWEGRLRDKAWGSVKTIIGIPLKYQNDIVGVITLLHTDEGKTFTENDLDILTRFSIFAATAIAHARLYESAQRELGERIRTEKALAKSEEKHRSIFQNANEDILIAQKGYFKFPNPAAVKLFGYSEKELSDIPIEDLIHPEHRTMVMGRHVGRQKGDDKVPAIYPFKILPKDRDYRWVMLKAARIDWEGEPASLCFMTDITDKKETEDELEQKTRQLKALHETTVELSKSLNLGKLLQSVLIQAANLVNVGHGSVYLTEQGITGQIIKVCAATGIYEDYIGYKVAPGQGLVGKVWETGTAMKIDDYHGWEGRHPDKAWDKAKSMIGISIKYENEIIGVINLMHIKEENRFCDNDLVILDQFANIAAAAIVNARLYEKAQNELLVRKRTENALAESEEKYRSIFENTNEAILIAQNESFIFPNPATIDLFGYSEEELTSRPLSDFIHPGQRSMVVEHHKKRIKGEAMPDIYPFKILPRDEAYKWVLLKVVMIDWEGQSAALCFMTDITQEVSAENALQESEKRYRTLTEASPFGIALVDDHNLTYINNKFTDIFGYTTEDLKGKDIDYWFGKTFPDQQIKNAAKAIWQDYKDHSKINVIHNKSFSVTCKDGAQKEIMFKTVKMENQNSLIFFEDITNQIRLEQQLQQAQKMEAIGTLAGGIAHDFNNLLMGIQGRISILMLLKSEETQCRTEHLKAMDDHVRSAAGLTRQLLGFAREGTYEIQKIKLNWLINKTIKLFGRTKKEIKVDLNLQDNLLSVEIDSGQIEQVLINLYVNAWQAMPGGGTLFVKTQNVELDTIFVRPFNLEAGSYVKLSVTDTGIGIDEKIQQKIFDPFFTTKEKGRGTGLGLASAYGIIKKHKGIITVYSAKGKGTKFNIYLPAVKGAPVKKQVKEKMIVLGNETILIVDDENMILEVSQKMISELGYKTITANGGEKAIEIFKNKHEEIDLVILDMIMPGMGGKETFEKLKQIDSNIKIIISSGYSMDGQAQNILTDGGNGFISKPFTIKDISVKLRKILD